jgi:histidinol-phosphate aminotransferase
MFERYALLAGGRVRRVGWPEGRFPLGAVLESVSSRTAAIAVVSPNNPTGGVVTGGELCQLLAELEGLDRAPMIIVDAAYAEFADEDLTPVALEHPGCVVLRSLSKAWGLAGLRVGYALGEAELLDRLRAVGPPYAVSGPSLALAAIALDETESSMRSAVERVRVERAELTQDLSRLGVHALLSQANFVLARPEDPGWLDDAFQGQGIAIRSWPRSSALAGWVRIGCPGEPSDFARLRHALWTSLRPEALLFDMDGVLADESESYRESILGTVRNWGVQCDHDSIVEIKATGGANNDWEVSHRLLRRAGLDVPLQEVIERFEAIYQGTPSQPGLRERETLIPPRELLERLSARLPLAIVTGRPRRDAERFLDRFSLRGLFAAVVTMEDAPLKPNPAPVKRALQTLDCERAWMIGDTPDDVRAARAAGVLPLGVLAPGATDALSFNALLDAGAARVLDTLSDVEVLLS